MKRLFFDTSAFHLIGDAFQTAELPRELRQRIEMSPITGIELLSHLCLNTTDPRQVIRQIHAIRNWLDLEGTTILDWPKQIVGEVGFNVQIRDDTPDLIGNYLNHCLIAETEEGVNALRPLAADLMDQLNRYKDNKLQIYKAFQASYRNKPPTEAEIRSAWVCGLAKAVGADAKQYDPDEVIERLGAYYTFDRAKLEMAKDRGYKPENHRNDVIDVDQVIQLFDPERHLISCDGIFERFLKGTSHEGQIHTVEHEQLRTPESVVTLVGKITNDGNG